MFHYELILVIAFEVKTQLQLFYDQDAPRNLPSIEPGKHFFLGGNKDKSEKRKNIELFIFLVCFYYFNVLFLFRAGDITTVRNLSSMEPGKDFFKEEIRIRARKEKILSCLFY